MIKPQFIRRISPTVDKNRPSGKDGRLRFFQISALSGVRESDDTLEVIDGDDGDLDAVCIDIDIICPAAFDDLAGGVVNLDDDLAVGVGQLNLAVLVVDAESELSDSVIDIAESTDCAADGTAVVISLRALSLILDVEGDCGVVAAGHRAGALHVARLHARRLAGDIGTILGVLVECVCNGLLSYLEQSAEAAVSSDAALESHVLSAALELLCSVDRRLISFDASCCVVGVETLGGSRAALGRVLCIGGLRSLSLDNGVTLFIGDYLVSTSEEASSEEAVSSEAETSAA